MAFFSFEIPTFVCPFELCLKHVGFIVTSPLFVYFAPFIYTMFTLHCYAVMTVARLVFCLGYNFFPNQTVITSTTQSN